MNEDVRQDMLEYGRIFSRIYDKRQSSDYDDFIGFTKEEV
jgi:uncharacterized protein (UPF0332 family)